MDKITIKDFSIAVNELPPRKDGWNHSKQVLVYYPGNSGNQIPKYGIAYYHYDPPFDGPHWIDFDNSKRVPSCWWELPVPSKE